MNLVNTRVKHMSLGTGVVVAQDEKYITVEFASKTSKFLYPNPETFSRFLRAEDSCVQKAIEQEMMELKRDAEKARLIEEEKQRAEEETRAAEKARLEAEKAKQIFFWQERIHSCGS